MKISIQSIGFTSTKKLTNHVQSKLKKFGRLFDKLIGIEVALRVFKSDSRANKVCGIRLVVPGNDMLASAQCKTFEEATAQVVEALERQIEKQKTKAAANRQYYAIEPLPWHNI